MINIFDKSKNKVFMTDRIIEPFLTCDINKLDVLTFEIDKENLKYFELEGYVETKEQIYVIKDIEELQYTFKIVALQEIEEFDEYLTNKTYPTKTLDFMIKDLLPSGWSLVFKGDTKKRTVTGNNINKFSLINEIIQKFKAEIRFDNKKKTVTVGYDLGEDNGSYFTDELNIKDIHFTADSYDLVTRIIPIGRDNLGIEKVNDGKPYIDNFEYSKKIKTMYWEDNRYLNVHSLFDDANKKLKKLSTPNITYEIDVIDLSENLKYEFLKMNLGDKVTLINKNSQKKEQFRIIKLVKYFKDSFRNEITLGTKVPDLTTDEDKLREVFNENWEKTKTYFEVVDGKITGIIDTVKSSETNIEKMKSEVVQTADEIKLKISKYDGLLGETSKKQLEILQKMDSLESSIYESTQLGKDNFLKNIFLNLSDTKEFKEYLKLENGSYSLKFLSKGDVEVYFVVSYKDENRKYRYKYPKKFLSLKKVGRNFNDLSFKEHLISFKVPKLYKDMYVSYKSKNGAELKEIHLGKLLSKENADRITRLKQDLDGFKLTAENNINKVKSEFNVKADEISSKVENVENKITTEIAQSTNEITQSVSSKIEDVKSEIATSTSAQIKASTDGINLEFNKKFENLQIGAVNMALESRYTKNDLWFGYQLTKKKITIISDTSDGWNGFKQLTFTNFKDSGDGSDFNLACGYSLHKDSTFDEGREYVISFLAKNYGEFPITFWMNGFKKTDRVTLPGGSSRKIILKATKENSKHSQIAVSTHKFGYNVKFAIAELMVEKGTIPSQWRIAPSERVNKDNVISSINLSEEGVKIRAKNIELDGDVIASKLTAKNLYGNYIDGAVINGSTIKIGNYGYFRPNSSGFVAVAPRNKYADDGIGMQLSGNADGSPSGIFLFESNDISQGGTHDVTQKDLLTVWGANTMAFKYNGRWEKEGKAICTNKYRNSVISFSNVNMYAVSSICYGDDGELYFDDGTDGDTHGWFVKVDRSYSDIRLKKNIKICKESGLDLIKKINFKSFAWKKKAKRKQKKYTKIGIIAQELEKIDDSLVYTEPNGTKCIDDFRLLAVTTKAVQELNKKVEELRLKIKQLEER